jgi:hypothetical protein
MFEKRKFPRLGEMWDLDYRMIGEKELKSSPLSSLSVNISGGGIRFEANEELPKGKMLALELKSSVFHSPIMALAKIIWCREIYINKFEVGAEFWWTGWKDNNSQQAMLDYINKHLGTKGN